MKSTLIVIAGPTAVGKTKLSIDLGKYLGVPIISADSRQFYKELNIGTAKPNNKELEEIKHYFIDNKSINELYSAGEFESDVINLLENHFKHKSIALMTGGSGMYINAVCNGLDDLPKDIKIREELNQKFKTKGILSLQEQLQKIDPVQFEKIDINNPQRIIRALEVCLITKKPYSSFLNKNKKKRPFQIVKFLLHQSKETLDYKINKRVDEMVKMGLFEEVKSLMNIKHLNALNTVGYKEIFHYYEQGLNKLETIEQIKSNTRKYAKRQMTWFKKDKSYIWIENSKENEALEKIKTKISTL